MGTALLALAGSQAAGQPGAPPAAAPAAPAAAGARPEDFVVVSRVDNTQAVESADLRLVLTKAKREEHALVRWLIFVTVALRTTEPLPPDDPAPASDAPAAPAAAEAQAAEPEAPQTCRWTYQAFLQRQVCFSSMTGLLGCTSQEITPLPDKVEGDAPLPQGGICNDAFRPALLARTRLTSNLIGRSKEIFAADQDAKIAPLFRAAGVAVRNEPPQARQPARPARR